MMTHADTAETYGWWTSLKHGGLLIAPSRLADHFPEEAPELPAYLVDRLRRAVVRALDGDEDDLPALMDTVLEDILGLDRARWRKGNAVEAQWSHRSITREVIRPRRVWLGDHGAALPVFVADAQPGSRSPGGNLPRIGVGRGRRPVSRVVEWLRRADQKIALLTNGRQWRLIHAGADYEAWCEWDIDLWFQEGRPGPQVTALRLLLGANALQPKAQDQPSALVSAILASRRGQAELSSVLGERVRLAVEHLIRVSAEALEPLDQPGLNRVSSRDIYIAATRIVMRCVVILFAEARDLLPRYNVIYHKSYGLQGLREQLERFAGGRASERLRHTISAWPRLLSLFRLVYEGSPHQALPIPRYSGGLFRPGDPESSDPILRALSAFESPDNSPSDAAVHRILELLTRSRVKVRQGNRSTWVEAPVDFSDLKSEYIGILYEGLLDFELRRAPENEPMVFLNIGDQPALPFMRLDGMSNKDLAELLDKLKKGTRKVLAEEEETEEEDEEAEEGETEEVPAAEVEASEAVESPIEEADSDQKRMLQEMVQTWAERAVKAARLVKYPRDDTDPVVREAFNRDVAEAARGLIKSIVMPGEWFLVRWGGTRKGSGTFYTRPQLAGPTARRTLQPLVYEPVSQVTDAKTGLVTVTEWRPRKPEEILALKVCDPAMGSGSFLVSALRFLVDALVESLHFHNRFESGPERTICKLADGLPSDHPSQENLPVPVDHEEFEDRLRARLKRHVVERSLYGVDLDPLAVELGRMALWVETMDSRLPFGFLDHKLRCGNSLVGCWFDRFQDYPALAWDREGGDKNHDRFVHHFREYEGQRGKKKGQRVRSGDKWTQAIKDTKNDLIKPELHRWIVGHYQTEIKFPGEATSAPDLHDRALAVFEQFHDLPVHETEKREELYREKVLENPDFRRLKEAFDTWCAIWFWPGDHLSLAPTPRNFLDPPDETRRIVAELTERHRFFHWELEFPDVFKGPDSGFDAVIGNPPWEIQKPSSKEFFSNVDPLYRTYGKQEALQKQEDYFRSDEAVEDGWLDYCARLKSLSNWVKHAAHPFGDLEGQGERFSFSRSQKENESLHETWRKQRAKRKGYADPGHPFRHQGSADINTYKMFLETAHALVCPNGRFGFLVPSGIYTDKGSTDLRSLFLSGCRWEWLFGFENREKVFDIDSRFKFCPMIVEKGGQTHAIRAAFMHRSLEDWEEAERHVLAYPRERVEEFSPKSKAILEIRSERDLQVLQKLYKGGVLLGDDGPDGWGIRYATEFHMTNDSKLFPPRPVWEAKGYRSDEYGHWLKGNWQPYNGPRSILQRPFQVLSVDGTQAIRVDEIDDVALPLYEGRMIGQFDFSQKGWVSGKGRRAVWRDIPWSEKTIEPQYLMAYSDLLASQKGYLPPKIAYMRISSSTNSRTTISTYLRTVPAGDSVFFLRSKSASMTDCLSVVGFFGTFIFDYQARNRLGGLNMSEFVMVETALPPRNSIKSWSALLLFIARLTISHPIFAGDWLTMVGEIENEFSEQFPWKRRWSLTSSEHLRLRCILDAVVAELYGLDIEDLAWILRDCDYPSEVVSSNDFTRSLDPKGFWRVDKEKDSELRHTVLSLVAFHELKRLGLDAFLALNDGDGWMLPETLRLADYGLGHDDRAKEPQPVASRLGPRFLKWQLEQDVEESWEECERHAEMIARIVPTPEASVKEALRDVSVIREPQQTYMFERTSSSTPRRRS